MKLFCFVICVTVFSVTCAFAGIKGDVNFVKVYENSAGDVTFDHKEHTERFLDKCGFCHSALRTFGGEVDKMFGHKMCRVCHEADGIKVECTQCHDKESKTK